MKLYSKKSIIILALALALFNMTTLSPATANETVDEKTSFDGSINLKAFVESTKKDYFDRVYSYDSPIPRYEKKEYDKIFYGTDTSLNLALKTDLNDTSFLDLEDSLYVRHFNREDPNSLGYSSNKYNDLDHNLRLTLGVAIGTYDYLQLDYINNITEGGNFDSLNYNSNKVKGLVLHDFNARTSVAFTGSYEEREYDIDKVSNYKEARGGFEVSSLVPGRDEYVQIANSSRGERATFEKIPGVMSNRRVIDYYTDYVRNPHDDDPDAKYTSKQARGDLYLRGFGEIARRERTKLDNDCDEVVVGLESVYKTTDDIRLRLKEVYTDRNYQRESNFNFLHDGYSNYLALTVDYDCTQSFSQSLTYSNEIYRYKKFGEEDNKANSVTYENFYVGKNYRVSVLIGAVLRSYTTPAFLFPKETEKRMAVCYDYDIIDSLTLRFKAEVADLDYHDLEDDIFSNYKRKTWRLAIEKGFNKVCSFEVAYQDNSEDHNQYSQNDIKEKTFGFSLVGKF